MISLLMLGIIPGTNIQIDFEDWLLAMSSLAAIGTFVAAMRHHAGFQRWLRKPIALARRRKFTTQPA